MNNRQGFGVAPATRGHVANSDGRYAPDLERPEESIPAQWHQLASAYHRRHVQSRIHAAPRVVDLRLPETSDVRELDEALVTATSSMAAGDVILLDLPSGDPRSGFGRDRISRALFQAGFVSPMMWAGRSALESESRGILSRLLSSAALGAGARQIQDVEGVLVPGRGQTVAVALLGAKPRPAQRTLVLSVVMPVYNEAGTFRAAMERVLAKAIPDVEIEICIVESNSTDGTRDQVLAYQNHPRVRILFEDKPSGKGHAVRAGLKLAKGDIILIQDADLEYDVDDYDKLIEPIRRGQASFVLGSRHSGPRADWEIRQFESQPTVASILNIGHLFFTWFLNTIFQQRLRDPFTMYKVFRRDCIHNVAFECNRFDFDHELVGKLVRNGFSPVEIGVHYESRSFHDGKKVSFFGDPPTWIKACLKHRFSHLYEWPSQGAK